ncbi:MAG: C13 family peptidase, partial [Pseudomonadota bacterium]
FAATLLAAQLFTMLLALRLAALAVGLGAQSRAFDVRLLPALMLSTLATYGLYSVIGPVYAAFPGWAWTIYLGATAGVLVFPFIGALRAVRRAPGGTLRRGLAAALVLVATLGLGTVSLVEGTLFETDHAALAAAEAGHGAHDAEGGQGAAAPLPVRRVDVEDVYYAQPRLMEAALADIRPGVPGEVELFALVAGLYPEERVFLREVRAVGQILADRFGAEGRVVRLLNSAAAPKAHALANRRNLERAAAALRAAMDPEDVLLLFLTSHGFPGTLSTGYSFPTPNLDTDGIAAVLAAGGGGPAILVVSACYSGSLLPPLAAPDRLLIAAAAADRTSFGCGDDRQWTFFSEALFARALTETGDWRAAFASAAALVGEWERAEGYPASDPQLRMGAEMAPRLDALAAQHQSLLAAQ